MKGLSIILAVLLGLLSSGAAWADLLVKLDDSVLNGVFKGGSDAAVMFEVKGQLQQVDLDEVFLLAFKPRASSGTSVSAPEKGGAPSPGSMMLVKPDNSVIHGKFKGGTDSAILFEVSGQVQQVSLSEVLLLVMNSPKTASGTAPATAAAAAPASGTAPAGTKLMVNLMKDVSTASHKEGATIEGVLAVPLTVEGRVLAPADTKVFGKVLDSRGGRVVGGSYILFTFTSLLVGDQTIPIKTSEVGAEAGKGQTAKAVGAGALIGAAAGSAATGAAIGGAAAVLMSRNNHLQIAAGTKAEVSLLEPVTFGKN